MSASDTPSSGTRRIVAIAGPTGGGKGDLAVAVAKRSGAIILSCDSMKIYLGLDIGTAKPLGAKRSEVTWAGLDLVQPDEPFDARAFVDYAESIYKKAADEARPVLICGGTALYLKALTEGLFDGPGKDESLRLALDAEENASPGTLHRRLCQLDPSAATKLHPNDRRRLIRALEVHTLTGSPVSALQAQFGSLRPGIERVLVFVRREREDMDRRIDARVDRMVEAGWIEECRALLASERKLGPGAMQAIGYPEILDWIRAGEPASDWPERLARIKTKTRRFARRQLTWLKQFPDAREIIAPSEGWPSELEVERLVKDLSS